MPANACGVLPSRNTSGQTNRSRAPQGLEDEFIRRLRRFAQAEEIENIATAPHQTWVQQTGKPGSLYTKNGKLSRLIGIGECDGVKIKVVIEPAGEGNITAYPTR